MGWRVFYGDGAEFSSENLEWSELPDDGVAVVVVYLEQARRLLLLGDDWYFQWVAPDGASVIASNKDPLWENERRYPGALFKRGKWTSSGMIARLNERAVAASRCEGCV